MIDYEWAIETVDEDGDILDVNHANSFSEALAQAKQGDEIALTRKVYNNIDDNLEDRAYAYVDDGKLPEYFDNGIKVPKRFLSEVNG